MWYEKTCRIYSLARMNFSHNLPKTNKKVWYETFRPSHTFSSNIPLSLIYFSTGQHLGCCVC